MATITSTNPIVENYQYWWIEKVSVSALNTNGPISFEATLRLCRIDEDGNWIFHPSHPAQNLIVPDINAVAAENMAVAITMVTLIDTISNMAKQAGLIN